MWWEGSWWRADGKGWDGKVAPLEEPSSSGSLTSGTNRWQRGSRSAWWKTLPPTEECPVSLTPICELVDEPFELTAISPSEPGAKDGPRHRFDASSLANFLVGSGQFMNPINRRPLEISECRALDKHLGKASVRVTEAFRLSGSGTAATAAERELFSVVHNLFIWPEVRAEDGRPGDNSPRSAARRGTPSAPGAAAAPHVAPVGHRDGRRVHNEGGLRVVDEGESDSDREADPSVEPTPAEAAAAAAAAASAAPLPKFKPRPRASQVDRAPTATCNSKPSCNGSKSSNSSSRPLRAKIEDDEDSSAAAASAADTWTPSWATPELQEAQLLELDELRSAGAISVDQESLAELRRCVVRGVLLVDGPGVHCETTEGRTGLTASFTVPHFYPTMPLKVVLRWRDRPEEGVPLAALEALLRDEVLRPGEGVPTLRAAVEWLRNEAPARVEALRAERPQPQAQGATRRAAAAAAAEAAPPPAPTPDASLQRKAEKYSPNWDLCTAFVKHGKCKAKNCKWRHEQPVKGQKADPDAAPKAMDAADAKKDAGSKKKKR